MKILITGGHFSPAYAVLEELLARGHEVAIAGRKHPFETGEEESYEYVVSKREKIPFYEVRTGRVQRKFNIKSLYSIMKVPLGLFDSINILSSFKPDMVLTFGGYVAFPVSYAAFIKGIPVVLHEQTQKAGLASKIISKVAKKILISFKTSQGFFSPNKTVLTGNPIRREVFKIDKKLELPPGKVVYITGGSAGSHTINSLIEPILPDLLSRYVVIHQAGESLFGDFEKLELRKKEIPEALSKKYFLRKFIYPEEIGFVLKVSDLIVSRSGINTVSEVIALGKQALFIPLAHGQFQEQLENAKLAKELDMGDLIEEKNISSEILLKKINQLIDEGITLKVNKQEDFIYEGAAQKIADEIENVYDQKKR